jgi:hypothetical protein
MLERDARWAWLFPITYAVHIAEEYAAGFPRWLATVSPAQLSDRDFVAINAIAMLIMILAVAISVNRVVRWPLVALGTLVTLNATLHIAGTLLTSYSPGVITATFIWLPLGLFTLRRLRTEVDAPVYAWGIAAGFAGHALVSAIAILG